VAITTLDGIIAAMGNSAQQLVINKASITPRLRADLLLYGERPEHLRRLLYRQLLQRATEHCLEHSDSLTRLLDCLATSQDS